MERALSRRVFVAGPCVGLAAGAIGWAREQEKPGGVESAREPKSRWPGFPHQDPEAVREFVGACHGNLEKVKAMVAEHPALAKAAWDWGYGDWETALGAAAHTGRTEIARLLLEHGARLDLFGAAMLGMTEAVKAMVAAQPGVEKTPGPHGIPLLAHANAGANEGMIEYLKALPGATVPTPERLTDEQGAVFVGEYATTEGVPAIVSLTRFGLAVKVGSGADRTLMPLGVNRFHPVGAPNVLVTFTVIGKTGTRVEFVEGAWFASAVRAG